MTLPDFVQLGQEIGGEFVTVDSFLDGSEDPHFVDAVPSFISKAAKADVVCSAGLDLEIGWLPKVLAKSSNAKIQPGGKGFCEFGRTVYAAEKPLGSVDRSHGDVHAAGNPHFYLSPTHMTQASKEMLRILIAVSPENESYFKNNQLAFEKKMLSLKETITRKLAPFKKITFIQYHKEFTYFFLEYSLSDGGSIEEKPGVPPSASRIASVANDAKARRVGLALAALHTPKHYLEKFNEFSQVPYLMLPTGVQKLNPLTDSIEELQNFLADEILRAVTSAQGLK